MSKKKTGEAFKPTPILNEISVEDEEMGQRKQVAEDATEKPAEEPTPAEET